MIKVSEAHALSLNLRRHLSNLPRFNVPLQVRTVADRALLEQVAPSPETVTVTYPVDDQAPSIRLALGMSLLVPCFLSAATGRPCSVATHSELQCHEEEPLVPDITIAAERVTCMLTCLLWTVPG